MGDAVDLVREELREISQAVHGAAGSPPEPFGLYAFASGASESMLARWVERVVFDEFFGNSPELLASEYGKYEAATVFLCVLDHRRNLPAAMMRVVLPSNAGFKSLDDIEAVWRGSLPDVLRQSGVSLDFTRVWDIATLAVAPEYRGKATNGLVSLSLYQTLGITTQRAGARWLVTILDLVVLDLIQQATANAFMPFRGLEPLSYLDSPSSLPVWCDLDVYFARVAATDPEMYKLLGEGVGLEAAVRPLEGGRVPNLTEMV